MSRTYRATGINLKGMALGESDRLLTILTKEHGLIRAVAAGARKHKSGMAGRSGMFVVNDLMISPGRNLDRITQAETLQSFVGLGQNLTRLTAAQYLAELTLLQALSGQPQEELFLLLTEHLQRLQQVNDTQSVLAALNHGIYHLLAIAGLAPQVHICCITQQALTPLRDSSGWQSGFSITGGGVVALSDAIDHSDRRVSHFLSVQETDALQSLTQTELSAEILATNIKAWLTIERVLRAYAQYHFDRPIQSATLIDSCFTL
jgi:DNA repair protein RecO (recombination protein O)